MDGYIKGLGFRSIMPEEIKQRNWRRGEAMKLADEQFQIFDERVGQIKCNPKVTEWRDSIIALVKEYLPGTFEPSRSEFLGGPQILYTIHLISSPEPLIEWIPAIHRIAGILNSKLAGTRLSVAISVPNENSGYCDVDEFAEKHRSMIFG
jgi:hypothetical protein